MGTVLMNRSGQQPTRQDRGGQMRTFSTFQEVLNVLDDFVAELEAQGYRDMEIFGARLALEEAMVNAIKHGHGGDSSKEAVLRYQVTPAQVLVEVEDQGPGFDPASVPDPCAPENLDRPGGRGLLLMRHFMSWVLYNAAGNKVSMGRHRQPPRGPD
jgi:serine/threonine-protein kinase RsbW